MTRLFSNCLLMRPAVKRDLKVSSQRDKRHLSRYSGLILREAYYGSRAMQVMRRDRFIPLLDRVTRRRCAKQSRP